MLPQQPCLRSGTCRGVWSAAAMLPQQPCLRFGTCRGVWSAAAMLPQQPCLRSGTCYDVDPAGQGEAGCARHDYGVCE
ncbi:MAG: hypothetical protein KatS3mg056_3800 [Chloroflexus sp.]|nr:MAG: hypothetical protein KatS3mg056_3800 [Chloroflexus sp.]